MEGQNHNPGLQENRFQPVQGPDGKNPRGFGPGKHLGPGEMGFFQALLPPSSRMVQPNIKEVK